MPSKSNATVVASVEAELRVQLEDAVKGAPLIASPSVGAIWARVSGFQSQFVEGMRADALADVVEGVLAMFATLDGEEGEGASEAGGASSAHLTESSPLPASASADRLRRRVAQLEGENAQLQGHVAMLLQVAAAARGGTGGPAAAPAPRSAAAPTSPR